MEITKDRIHSWEQVGDKEYEKDFDDELIILLNPDETSKEMGDYILEIQKRSEWLHIIEDLIDEKITDSHSLAKLFVNVRRHKTKAEKYDKLERIVSDLTQRLKECENKK